MSLGAWEPSVALGEEHVAALDAAVESLQAADATRLRQVVAADADARTPFFQARESTQLVGWLRALTLAEEVVPGCDGGAKSPVIDIARLLRERGDYPAHLTAWIRSSTKNRFLPYGSLMDRLTSKPSRTA